MECDCIRRRPQKRGDRSSPRSPITPPRQCAIIVSLGARTRGQKIFTSGTVISRQLACRALLWGSFRKTCLRSSEDRKRASSGCLRCGCHPHPGLICREIRNATVITPVPRIVWRSLGRKHRASPDHSFFGNGIGRGYAGQRRGRAAVNAAHRTAKDDVAWRAT